MSTLNFDITSQSLFAFVNGNHTHFLTGQ